jgi:hypothetical protein
MKGYIAPILILGSIIGLIVYAIIYSFSNPEIENKVETYAAIKEFKSKPGSGRVSVFEYTINDKKYDFWGYYNNSLEIGDKFKLVYEKNKPKKSIILLDKPIFLENEVTALIKGKVKDIQYFNKKSLDFEYEVDGLIYSRTQVLPEDFENLFPNLEIEKYFTVRYLNDNPRRSIIYIE